MVGLKVRLASLLALVAVLLFSAIPAWAAKTFEIVGRWNSTYGRMIIRYSGLNPDGTVAIRGRWLYDREHRQIGKITGGTFNRKTGTINFKYVEDWSDVKGTANFKLSSDKTRFVGSYSDSAGGKGEWVLDRPLSESMINYDPANPKLANIDGDDFLFNDKKAIALDSAPAADTKGGTDGVMKSRDDGNSPVKLMINNQGSAAIRVNSVDTSGRESRSSEVIQGGAKKLLASTTFPGHVFRVREAKYDSLLKEFRVAKNNPNQTLTIEKFVP